MRSAACLGTVLIFCTVVVFGAKVDREGKVWLSEHAEAAEMTVNGVWASDDWGKVTLRQEEGSRDVTGLGDGWDITGVVSGKSVYLLFSDHGEIMYSAVLTAEGDKRLAGSYCRGLMKEGSKTRPMILVR